MPGRVPLINSSYGSLAVGTGAYTDNMLEALPEAGQVRLDVTAGGAFNYWRRRVRECRLGSTQVTIHPYWAASVGPKNIISVLDFVQFDEATAIEQILLSASAKRATSLLCLSASTGADIESRLGKAPILAPPFPRPEWYALRPTPRPIAGSIARFAYWGGWHARKNAVSGIQAVAFACRQLGVQARFHVTGDPPDILRGPEVVRLGELTPTELVAEVDQCDVALYPSLNEGYGLPVMEALLRRKPVLASSLPVYDEFASYSERISVHDWNDPDDVVSAVSQSLGVTFSDPHRREYEDRQLAVRRLRSALQEAVNRS